MAQLDSELHLRAEPCARALDGGAAGLARREEGLLAGGGGEGLRHLRVWVRVWVWAWVRVWVWAWVRVWVWVPAS